MNDVVAFLSDRYSHEPQNLSKSRQARLTI